MATHNRYNYRMARKRIGEQRWSEEVQSKKTLDLYVAVKKHLKEEKYVNDPVDKRGARLKFRLTRTAGLRAEMEEQRRGYTVCDVLRG